MCSVLQIPKSSYYKTLNPVESNRAKENKKYKEKILKIYNDSNKRYGAPKIHKKLEKWGYKISLKRVQRLMKKLGISSIVKKKYRPHSSKVKVKNRENIISRDFTTNKINEKWVSDITYIHTIKDGWCYLASVMDLHTRKIVGYSFSKTIDTNLTKKALENAIVNQSPDKNLILHTDLGSQYTSYEFCKIVEKYNIIHSFSQKGCPYDNACIESFHSILKKEEVNHVKYYDYETAKIAIFKYIESWYNRERIHSSIDYMTPHEYENHLKKIG